MSEKNQQSLSSLLKKQIKADNKQSQIKKSAAKIAQDKEKISGEQDDDAVKKMTEEEQTEDAKKASRNKAAQYDQSRMIKKMIIEAIVKYTIIMAVLVVMAIGVIEVGPAMIKALNSFFRGLIMGAIGVKN